MPALKYLSASDANRKASLSSLPYRISAGERPVAGSGVFLCGIIARTKVLMFRLPDLET